MFLGFTKSLCPYKTGMMKVNGSNLKDFRITFDDGIGNGNGDGDGDGDGDGLGYSGACFKSCNDSYGNDYKYYGWVQYNLTHGETMCRCIGYTDNSEISKSDILKLDYYNYFVEKCKLLLCYNRKWQAYKRVISLYS